MCGISGALINSSQSGLTKLHLQKQFFTASRNIVHRGPDRTKIEILSSPIDACLAFERLAIMDTSTRGDQPFVYDNGDHTVYAMCNGEIYNHHEYVKKYLLETKSGSDCEVIPLMYKKFGMAGILEICHTFDSEHAFVILDVNRKTGDYKAIFSSDRFGIRPLFTGKSDDGIYFSSELCGIADKSAVVERFKPRHFAVIEKKAGIVSDIEYTKYYDLNDIKQIYSDIEICKKNISDKFEASVERSLQSDRPVGALLSGGVDSSLSCAYAAKKLKQHGKVLKTFSIGLSGGTDEKYAKKVAKFIGSRHIHFLVTKDEFISAQPNVIITTGTFDVTSVRASVGQYLVAKYIDMIYKLSTSELLDIFDVSTDDGMIFTFTLRDKDSSTTVTYSDELMAYIRELGNKDERIAVLLCGDGSDEVCGSYKYFHKAPTPSAFHQECLRLLNDIHYFDGLRADRCISHFGFEARYPFLCVMFVEAYLSCCAALRMPQNGVEKWLLRESFSSLNILPHDVLFRSKEAFSDGVSSTEKSWYQIIQEHVETLYTQADLDTAAQTYPHLPPSTKEALHYRNIFSEHYGKSDSVAKTVPYKWLPKWCGDIVDPSARVLDVY